MRKSDPAKRRTLHAARVRTSTLPDTPTPTEELSNYELLERRSRELQMDRARGGFGTPQPPDADTPLLFPRFAANPVSHQNAGALAKRKP